VLLEAPATTRQSAGRAPILPPQEGFLLVGRVMDLGGGPIEGARVLLGPPAARSDAEGRYALTLAPGGHRGFVVANGYAHAELEVFVEGPTTRDVRLLPGARIAGRVVAGATGEPTPGAELTLSWSWHDQSQQADRAGRFDFHDLEPGHYDLVARQGRLVGKTATIALTVAATRADLVLTLDRGSTVGGRVLDPDGHGLDDARLEARPARSGPSDSPPARARTEGAGRYLFEGLLPGAYDITATAEGRRPAQANARVSGDVRDFDLVLRPGLAVRGRVLTSSGGPVGGAKVVALLRGPSPTHARQAAHSTDDGSYELEHLGPGLLTIVARHGLGVARFGPEPLGEGAAKVVDLVLRPGGIIAGQARHEDGTPAGNIRVSAAHPDDPPIALVDGVTGPDGRYRLSGLVPGRLLVTAGRASTNRAPSEELVRRFVEVGDGDQQDGVDLVIPALEMRIEGRALAPDGRPLMGASITATDEEATTIPFWQSERFRTHSDADGRFTVEGLHRARYALRVSHPEYQEVTVRGVTAGARDLVVRLAASGGGPSK
jgi:protocatechuate 3,4-dioxygenase beta subunit